MKSLNSGLAFPKPVRKKKRMKHKASILGSEKGICYICDRLYGDRTYKYTERHHIMYGGGKRKDSEELGLTVYLCRNHHREGPEAVHNNRKIREYLCREAQEAFEQDHTRGEWMNMGFKDYFGTGAETGENAGNTKCDSCFGKTEEPEGAAVSVEPGEYIGYIWDGSLEYGYVLGYGPKGTVWVGEEPDTQIKKLVETRSILR